ncbi:MAG: ATP-binding cassette domain-containing protein [bacterium]
MIKVKNLKFKYNEEDKEWILKGLSFSMQKGERLALMGANGSGKTTLVRCLNGLLQIQEGEIEVNDLHLSQPENLYKVRSIVGMVFQNPDNQIVSTTVEREIAFGLENLGFPSQLIQEKVEKTLIEFDLTKYRTSSPHLLSGGEKQRLAFASVWVMDPEFLILDETTSMLDYSLRQQLFKFLDQANKEKKMGILLVTQFSQEILNFDRLIILDNGKIMVKGKPRELFATYKNLTQWGIRLPAELELVQYIRRRL